MPAWRVNLPSSKADQPFAIDLFEESLLELQQCE